MMVLQAGETGNALEGGLKYRHHHLICIRCDRAISVQDDLPEGLEGKLSLLPDSVL
ncbi:hypothetical protein NSB25_02495 [Acetatifactor muris]|jgi:Fe2+ or Zn2+ uptake regulation protein|uniref:hypothetical protein n=1 Tax=Acetatifactor muris TaxID=879566 RepID=UPI001559059B|nr:hypothetical protein [Acetatifactor muris]MCI8798730.1 hypothetical protein [Lachnospiraceae bacterium]MCR2046147.1 hypothetical protein [Acetatifactor muris]